MSFEPICWFLHDSVTAGVGRRAFAAVSLVAACAAVVLAFTGAA